MTDLMLYVEIANKIGVILGGILLFVALHKRWLVLGWVYVACAEGLATCRTNDDARASKAEAELDELRRERMRREHP